MLPVGEVSYSGQGKATPLHGECAAQLMLQDMKAKDAKRVQALRELVSGRFLEDFIDFHGFFMLFRQFSLRKRAFFKLGRSSFCELSSEEESEKKQISREEHGIGQFSVPLNLNTAGRLKCSPVPQGRSPVACPRSTSRGLESS